MCMGGCLFQFSFFIFQHVHYQDCTPIHDLRLAQIHLQSHEENFLIDEKSH